MSNAPAVCPHTRRGPYGTYEWPCVLAAGHGGDCVISGVAKHADYPLDQWPAEQLRTALELAWHNADAAARANAEASAVTWQSERDRNAVIAAALARGAGRSAKHGPLCWLRHPYCLARVLTRMSGVVDALRELEE